MNTNILLTTIICGVQGAGKLHSVSVIIKNSLISSLEIRRLPQPLSTVVFHLGASQGGMHLPCELAFLGKSNTDNRNYKITINVLVSPSNIKSIRKVYDESRVNIIPLYLSTKDLNYPQIFSLMHVTEDGKVPLYIQVVQQILSFIKNEELNYIVFKRYLIEKSSKFTAQQRAPLNLRIQLLESFLLKCQKGKVSTSGSIKQYFKQGMITIVDLTDLFLNAASANALFDIVLSLFLEIEVSIKKLLILNEAHKVCKNFQS